MRIASIAVMACIMLVACTTGNTPVKAAVKAPKDRRPAPEFTLKDSDGRPVKLADYKGKVVLLNFWATWCGPCRIEIPWFVDFEKTHKDRGFAVLGVSMDEDGWEAVKPFMQEHKVNYRMVIGSDDMAQKYGGVDSLPTTFLIDREGRIASTHIGLVSKKDYLNDIQQLLETAVSGNFVRAGVPALLTGPR